MEDNKELRIFKNKFSIEIIKNTSGVELLKLFAYPKNPDENIKSQFKNLYEVSYDSLKNQLENGMTNYGSGSAGYDTNFILAYRNRSWYTQKNEISFEEAIKIAEDIKKELITASMYLDNKDFSGFYDYVSNSRSGLLNKGYTHKYFYILYPQYITFYHACTWQRYYKQCLGLSKTGNYYDIEKFFIDNDINCHVGKKSKELIEKYGTPDKPKKKEIQQKINNALGNIPLNQILYGPPGTGKTYNTVLKAMSIIDNTEYIDVSDEQYKALKTRFDEFKKAGQIEFVTFHQSYSYEEFVEGIKPYIQEWGSADNTEVRYIGENGIFKNICVHAKPIVTTTIKREPIDFSNTKVFKMSLGNTLEKEDDIYDYCIKNNVVSLGWKDVDFSNCKTSQDFKDLDNSWGATALERFVKWIDIGDIIIISNGNQNFRAIAQAKSNYIYDKNTPIPYTHFRKVEWLYNGEDIHYSKINNKLFSQQSIYGYFDPSKKGQVDYNPDLKTDELNKIITGEVNEEISKPHILIIDEINRGDISRIFGELITLIEEDKRIGEKHQMKITLPYSKESFGVPKNLYIIGTMNTADRSIALLDTALRRRFDFEEMMPRPELLSNEPVEGTNINLQTLLIKINERITDKYDRDHQIGHSYLMEVKTKEQLERAYKNRILPLLNEYFYNESKTVAEVLNCSEDELNKADFITILTNAQGM